MKFAFLGILLVSLSVWANAHNVEGVYEQQPYMDFTTIPDEERRTRAIEHHEKNKHTVVFQKDKVSYHALGEVLFDVPYERYGPVIVAHKDDMYLVLYVESEDTLRSTAITYKKTCCD